MPIIYLDTNIVSYLQEPQASRHEDWYPILPAIQLYISLSENKAVVVYSPAHLSDIRQGYVKDRPRAMDKLAFLSSLTNDECICKYIGSVDAHFEKRNPTDFFLTNPDTDEGFYRNDGDKQDLLSTLVSTGALDEYRNQHFDYAAAEPILNTFGFDFTRTRIEPTRYSLMLDLIENLSIVMNESHIPIRMLREKARTETGVADKIRGTADPLALLGTLLPQTTTGARILEMIAPRAGQGANDREEAVRNCFMNLDLLGFSSDKLNKNHPLATTTVDIAHCYYASYCDIFVTNDSKTAEKAAAVISHLQFTTLVFDIKRFGDWIALNS